MGTGVACAGSALNTGLHLFCHISSYSTDLPAVAPQISTAINANKIVHQLETLVNTEARLAITVTRLSAYLGQQLSLTTEI